MFPQTRPAAFASLLAAATLGTNVAHAQLCGLTFGGIVAPAQFNTKWGAFGQCIAPVPDVNGDGIADLLIGAPNQTASNIQNVGRAYLWSGKTNTYLRMIVTPNKTLNGHFGQAVSAGPDFNADGVPDLLIGAPREDSVNGKLQGGRVYIINPKNGASLRIIQPINKNVAASFGAAVALVPDTNADGVPDILVGAPQDTIGNGPYQAGAAYLFSGKTGDQLHLFTAPTQVMYGSYGSAVAGIPDLNGDGRGDVAIAGIYDNGPSQPQGCGHVYIYSGKSGAFIRTLSSPGAEVQGFFGTGIAGLPDLNGDGRGEIVVGAPQEDPANDPNGCGRAYVFSGTGALLYKLIPPAKNSQGVFGTSVASSPDLDGDGTPDLLVGEPGGGWADKPVGTGAVHAYSGKTGKRLYSFGSPNAQNGGAFGRAIAGLPDTNADGKADIIVGAPNECPIGAPEGCGRAYQAR